jgi:pimeloyl-ACP methyl ester carboxylesterase
MQALPQARIYAPDLRGYPGTDQPRTGYDVFTLTDDVKALIEALQLDRPMLVTHDLRSPSSGVWKTELCPQQSLSGAALTPAAKWKLDHFPASVTSWIWKHPTNWPRKLRVYFKD